MSYTNIYFLIFYFLFSKLFWIIKSCYILNLVCTFGMRDLARVLFANNANILEALVF